MVVGIKDSFLGLFWNLRKKNENFSFKGRLEEKKEVLVILPENPSLLSIYLPVVISIEKYFKGKKWLLGGDECREVLSFFRNSYHFLDDKKGVPKAEILIDLRRRTRSLPNSSLREAKIRISQDASSFPHYNFIIEQPEFKDDIEKSRYFLKALGIPLIELKFEVPEEEKRKGWENLIFLGHKKGNCIIFIERKGSSENLIGIIREVMGGKVTVVGSENGGSIPLRGFGFNDKLAILSLSDLYITSDGFFLFPAISLSIPTLYVGDTVKIKDRKSFVPVRHAHELRKALRQIFTRK